MKKIINLLSLLLITHIVFSQTPNSCVSCNNNVIDTTMNASALGSENISTGLNSFAGGYQSEANAEYSFAFGDSAMAKSKSSFALGSHSLANGWYSVAIGRGCVANDGATFVLGYMNEALAESSFIFGERLKSTAGGAFAIGMGAGSNYLINNKSSSLMVGFNSAFPTLFVKGKSSTNDDKTGKVGIGNMTEPEAKLHIFGDDDIVNQTDASLFIESAGNYHAYLWIGDKNHEIRAKQGSNFIFDSNENDFVFEGGNIGIDTEEPLAKLQVNNGDIFIEDIDRGIIMKSPDGNCWRGTLDNSGELHFVQINCDDLVTENPDQLDKSFNNVKIYPNPAGDRVFISIDQELLGNQIEICDINGKILYSQVLASTDSSVDLTKYSSGTYILNVKDKNGSTLETTRIIKR